MTFEHSNDLNIVTTRKKYLQLSFRLTFKREEQFRNGAIIDKRIIK